MLRREAELPVCAANVGELSDHISVTVFDIHRVFRGHQTVYGVAVDVPGEPVGLRHVGADGELFTRCDLRYAGFLELGEEVLQVFEGVDAHAYGRSSTVGEVVFGEGDGLFGGDVLVDVPHLAVAGYRLIRRLVVGGKLDLEHVGARGQRIIGDGERAVSEIGRYAVGIVIRRFVVEIGECIGVAAHAGDLVVVRGLRFRPVEGCGE